MFKQKVAYQTNFGKSIVKFQLKKLSVPKSPGNKNEKYCGQNRRTIKTRYRAHFPRIKYGRSEELSVTRHK